MPVFQHRTRRYFITTSFKVMFSTLTQQASLQPAPLVGLLVNQALWRVRERSVRPHYLVARDPFERLASMFRDKFRRHPKAKLERPDKLPWQDVQRRFLQKLRPGWNEGQTAETLLGISFEEMIDALPDLYQTDGHLQPQANARVFWLRGLAWPARYSRVLKMESASDLRFMRNTLGLEMAHKHNATSTGPEPFPVVWGKHEVDTVRRLYREDFHWLGYLENT
jgi:hypothetical protein